MRLMCKFLTLVSLFQNENDLILVFFFEFVVPFFLILIVSADQFLVKAAFF